MDLVTFLRARLDEREAAARQFTAALAGSIPSSAPFVLAVGMRVSDAIAQRYNLMGQYQMDPAHVLADVAAKRRIVEHVADRLDPEEEGDRWEGADAETDGMASLTLGLLAAPFASHPDYDPAWSVEGTVTT